jgi:hypothetical protein
MRETALRYDEVNPLGGIYLQESGDRATTGSLFGDLAIVVFLCSQVLDGIFTYMGLQVFGHGIEANPLMAWLISAMGPVGALASAKSAAIAAGAFLHLAAVHGVVALLTAMYLLLAIGPWTHLLFFF